MNVILFFEPCRCRKSLKNTSFFDNFTKKGFILFQVEPLFRPSADAPELSRHRQVGG
jgi:hypothetical protein